MTGATAAARRPFEPAGILGRLGLVRRDGAPRTTVEKHAAALEEGRVVFTAERRRLHDAIVERFLRGRTPVAAPVAISTAGPPAVGKSTLLAALRLENFVRSDSDEIVAQLPEYAAMVRAGDPRASTLAITEAGIVAARLRAAAARRRLNVAVDTTGDSQPGPLAETLRTLHDAGYAVEVKYVDAPVGEAWRRQVLRAARTGRWLPWRYFEEMHAKVPRRLLDVLELAWAGVEVYDNSGDAPVLVMRRPAGGRLRVTGASARFTTEWGSR